MSGQRDMLHPSTDTRWFAEFGGKMAAEFRDIGLWRESDVLQLPIGEFDWLEFKESRWVTSDESKFLHATLVACDIPQ